ncbi:heterokaryon incompatibility protein-domain-containing protein [Annulohypoxylon maeteangense]|uniref:heterokaryon incompatibility protein-domain-containing protein n=1 Tax=Annulohypoxylon maeteangense TaxID=1927788 RepID=UPI0020084D5C|nr:heterokaryon incompatibility protein-domain-containing protein [Annulohypoxylon maeteangense]KAI0883883.1 heterokaryon incompatibility protein-domain-containing protein [Annulohypoxylon maeteangense]
MSKSSDWEAWEQALKVKGCSESCWVRNLSLPDEQEHALPDAQGGLPSVDDKIREAAAAKLYQNIRPWQTRILRIEPATQLDKPVICTLLVADVIAFEGLGVVEEDGPKEIPYEALSYTWGAPVFSLPIQINGIEFFITANLDSALRHLRLGDSKRYLWVDALCINQFDTKEKSVQVGRMFSIYKKARRVVAWNSGWSAKKSIVLSTVLANMSNSQKHSEDCVARFKRLYQFLVKACEPPLFKRTWVRQEAFAARDMVMQFSGLQISWGDYERIRDFIALIRQRANVKYESSLLDFTDAIYLKSPFNAIMTLVQPDYKNDPRSRDERDQAAVDAPVSLLDSLVFSSSFGVTDPRDLVYGILGFTTVPVSQTGMDISQPTLKVDYGRSISEVYQDVVKYEVARTESLDILDFAASHPDPSDIPSWVPDWRTYDYQLVQHRVLNKTNSWKYGFIDVKRVGVSWKPIQQPPGATGVLSAKGIVLGTLHDKIDDTTAWRPFISTSFESGFKKRFGGRNFDDTELFPGVSRDYKLAFNDMLKDEKLPLYEGKLAGVRVTKAGIRLITLLQNEMLERIKHDLRDRVIVPPEPIRGNHTLGCASSDISLAPKRFQGNDIIVLFQGSQCPFVLRASSPGRHTLIGRAIFPFWFEHKSSSFDDLRMEEMAWTSPKGIFTQTSDILESRLKWPEKMASIWRPVLRDTEFLNSLEDFQLV